VLAYLAGFVLAFASSIPIAGPISALVFSRALRQRGGEGLRIAVGAALAEAAYAGAAFYGVGVLFERFAWVGPVSRLVAAFALVVVGILLVRMKHEQAEPIAERAGARHLALGFTISAFNPGLISTWSAASAVVYSSGLGPFSNTHAPIFAIGVLTGILAWFTLLVRVVEQRHATSSPRFAAILRTTGATLILIGLSLFAREMLLLGA
jgi:threonine/homoserine/homoserine lactone efflux protein